MKLVHTDTSLLFVLISIKIEGLEASPCLDNS